MMCRFCVLYGSGVVIEVNTKDVPTDWLLEQLTQMG